MNFLELSNTFANNESGAVTVDWVAMTAVIVVVGTSTLLAVNSHIQALSADIGTHIASQDLS